LRLPVYPRRWITSHPDCGVNYLTPGGGYQVVACRYGPARTGPWADCPVDSTCPRPTHRRHRSVAPHDHRHVEYVGFVQQRRRWPSWHCHDLIIVAVTRRRG
jgi:hypothetical protein